MPVIYRCAVALVIVLDMVVVVVLIGGCGY